MLFTDIPKVTRLAQFALTSSHQRRIPENLAVGMAQLGPVMTFEMVGKVMVIFCFIAVVLTFRLVV